MAQDENNSNHVLLLGQIKGQLSQVIENQKENKEELNDRFDKTDAKLATFDERIRSIEQKSATYGAVSGGIVAVGMALVIEKLKVIMGGH